MKLLLIILIFAACSAPKSYHIVYEHKVNKKLFHAQTGHSACEQVYRKSRSFNPQNAWAK